jgi:hypothetical protein
MWSEDVAKPFARDTSTLSVPPMSIQLWFMLNGA